MNRAAPGAVPFGDARARGGGVEGAHVQEPDRPDLGPGVAFVHAGMHKTGTSSFQRWASQNRGELAKATGVKYYNGLFGLNHYEIAMLCMRTSRNMPMRVKQPDWCLEEWQRSAESHVRDQITRRNGPLLISAEALSYLRHADEIERMRDLLRPRYIVAIIVLREPADYLRSYRQSLLRQGFPPSAYRESFAYVEDDSWLVDYQALLDAYETTLGADHTVSMQYELALAEHGSIIPAIVDAMGCDASSVPSWDDYWLKDETAGPARRARARLSRVLAKASRRVSS